jgi:hypothetical protein
MFASTTLPHLAAPAAWPFDAGMFASAVPTALGETAGVLATFSPEHRGLQESLQAFTRSLNRPTRAAMTTFDRFERDESTDQVSVADEVEVRLGQPSDLAGAATLIRLQLPALVADAMDIHADRLMTSATTAGLSGRARAVLVLRVKGRLAGVALCETGPREQSLFHLVNLAQVYVCPGGRAPAKEAQLALLAAVRGLYRDRGLRDPIIVAPAGTLAAAREPGTRWAEAIGCVVMAGQALGQWASFEPAALSAPC